MMYPEMTAQLAASHRSELEHRSAEARLAKAARASRRAAREPRVPVARTPRRLGARIRPALSALRIGSAAPRPA